MDRETIFKLRRAKKKVEDILNRRNDFIVDKIFQNNIYVSGTTELVDQISNKYHLAAQIAIFEDSRIGLNFKNKEFHTVYFVEKTENLKNFIMACDDSFNENLDKIIGLILYYDKITDGYGATLIGLDEDFNKENVKKMLESLFPNVDAVFGSMTKDSMTSAAEQMMLEGFIDLQRKKRKL